MEQETAVAFPVPPQPLQGVHKRQHPAAQQEIIGIQDRGAAEDIIAFARVVIQLAAVYGEGGAVIAERIFCQRFEKEDHRRQVGQNEVHCNAGDDRDKALPHRLVVHGAGIVVDLVLAHKGAVAPQRYRPQGILDALALPAQQLRPEAH